MTTNLTFNSAGQVIGGFLEPAPYELASVLTNVNGKLVETLPQVVPLNAVANQTFSVGLNGQSCRFRLYARRFWVPDSPPGSIVTDPPVYEQTDQLFLDTYVNDVLILGGALCLTGVRIIRNPYLGFVGDITFYDTYLLSADPQVSGLGSRWLLLYWPNLP